MFYAHENIFSEQEAQKKSSNQKNLFCDQENQFYIHESDLIKTLIFLKSYELKKFPKKVYMNNNK